MGGSLRPEFSSSSLVASIDGYFEKAVARALKPVPHRFLRRKKPEWCERR